MFASSSMESNVLTVSSSNFCEKFHLVSDQKKTHSDMLHFCSVNTQISNFLQAVKKWLQNSSFEKSWEFIILRVFVFEFVRISGRARKQDLACLLVKLAGKTTKYKTL